MVRSRILGTGFAVPDRVVTNDDLARIMDTSDEWIRTRTGIRERRWVREGETGVELVFLQRMLGLAPIPAIDVRTQCSGFVYALSIADAYVRTGQFRRLLVVGAEVQSTGLEVSSRGRNTAVIFADGAGAVVVGPAEDDTSGILGFDLHSDGTYAEKLWVDAPGSMYHPRASHEQIEAGRQFLEMDGREVFRHAVARMPESVRAVLAAAGHPIADLKLLLAHQANLRIAEAIQKELGLRDDQVYNNIASYGNTTAATIPIALDECVRAGRIKRGDLLVFTAFGSGFLWGSAAVRW
jgi:3-oxoacyl-[acyl-carrier-protein] synthase-3